MAEIDKLVINVEVTGDTKELGDIALLIEGIDKKTEKATSKMASFGASIKNMLKSAAFIQTMRYLGNAVNKSMEYTESLNLFTVAMGDYADEAKKYAENVSEVMGIDPAEWLKAQGTFNILATGFGVTADKAAVMSKNLTQLGYDLSSFYNINVQNAMLKLQSGMAGELEPLRRLGYDLSVARLQQEAYALGIDKSITAMNQAEKSMLRYHAIMSQVTQVQGDMARTLESPANQTRILKAQITQLTRSIGNILIPVINKLLPYLIAMAQVAREAAESIALFFGFELPEVDYSSVSTSVGDIATDLDDANDTAKELKRTLMGFDEINRLNDTSSGTSGAGAGGGVGFDMDLLEYNFLGDALKKDLDDVKSKMQTIMGYIPVIAAGFAGWNVAKLISDLLIAKNIVTKFPTKMAIGITLSLMGLAHEVKGVISAIQTELNKVNFTEILAGGGLTIGGAALVGAQFGKALLGGGIGAVIAGVPMYITGVYDAIKNGMNWLNSVLVPLGSTLAGAGVGAIIGSLAGPVGTGIGALVGGIYGLIAGLLTDIGLLVYDNWDKISVWANSNIISPMKTFFAPLIKSATEFWGWLKTNVFQPISNAINIVSVVAQAKFVEIANGVSVAFTTVWNKIVEIKNKIVEVATALGWAFTEYVWNPLAQKVTNFYNTYISPIVTVIKDVCAVVWQQIKAQVFDRIKNKADELSKFITGWGTAAVNVISDIFKRSINLVLTSIENKINNFISLLNGAIGVINKIPGVAIAPVQYINIPKLATGGFPEDGLFMANHGELVGKFSNGKTAVANNEQIIEGIYRGVYQAMKDSGGNNGGQRIVVMLPNGDVLGETVVNWHNGVVKQTGTSPLYV